LVLTTVVVDEEEGEDVEDRERALLASKLNLFFILSILTSLLLLVEVVVGMLCPIVFAMLSGVPLVVGLVLLLLLIVLVVARGKVELEKSFHFLQPS